jgi:hypothetical protein
MRLPVLSVLVIQMKAQTLLSVEVFVEKKPRHRKARRVNA